MNKKTTHNTVYKKLLVLAGTKLVARLPASDFPSENPRPQTRNFPYTNTLCLIVKRLLKLIITNTNMDFSTIWNGHKTHLFNFIKDKVASPEVAEDILQEVGIKYYNALKNGEIEKDKPWLFKVARNTIADFYRNEFEKVLPTQSEITEIADQNSYNACVCDLTGFVIQHYLPEKYGKALFMADIENVPQKKIAETLNISFTATKSRI